jgi:hypothetical protein
MMAFIILIQRKTVFFQSPNTGGLHSYDYV